MNITKSKKRKHWQKLSNALLRIVMCRISFHNYKNIGRWHIRVSKSKTTYTDGIDVMYHFRIGYNEMRITWEY